MIRREVDDLALGKNPLQLPLEVGPLDVAVKVVERHGPAAQEELAQNRDLLVVGNPGAGLDEINPGIGEKVRALDVDDGRLVDLDRRHRLDPARRFCSAAG